MVSEAVEHDGSARAWRLRAAATPYLLLAPALLALAAVSLYPIFYGIRASVHRYRYGLDLGSAGAQNYRNIYHDPVFWEAIRTTAKFVVITVSIETLEQGMLIPRVTVLDTHDNPLPVTMLANGNGLVMLEVGGIQA